MRKIFVDEHRLSMQVDAKMCKKTCVQRVHIPTDASILHATVGGWVLVVEGTARSSKAFQRGGQGPFFVVVVELPLILARFGDKKKLDHLS